MPDVSFVVSSLRWISAILAFLSGLSALIWDPCKKDPETGRRRLTPTGWIRILTTIVSLVIFLAMDYEDRRRAAERAEQEQARLAADVKFKDEEVKALKQIIDSQERALRYFRHLVLVQEELDGLALTWKPSPALYAKLRADREIDGPLKGPSDTYFRTCLLTLGMHAERSPTGRWHFRCTLSRPLGVRELRFDYAPDQPQGQAFERLLDHLLSPHLSIRQVDGEYLVLITPESRPASVRFAPHELSLSVRAPAIKLNRLERARVEFRMDIERSGQGPALVTITSLDPNVRLAQTVPMRWTMRRSGTAWRYPGPGEEPEEIPLYSAFSGPHELRADFSKLLFPADQPPHEAPPSARP